MACSSRAGFRAGSRMKTWLAEVRLMPTLPLRMDSRNTVVGGSFWKASIACKIVCVFVCRCMLKKIVYVSC